MKKLGFAMTLLFVFGLIQSRVQSQSLDSLYEIHYSKVQLNDAWKTEKLCLFLKDSIDRIHEKLSFVNDSNQLIIQSISEFYYTSNGLDSIAIVLVDSNLTLNHYTVFRYNMLGQLEKRLEYVRSWQSPNTYNLLSSKRFYYDSLGNISYSLDSSDNLVGICIDSTSYDMMGRKSISLKGCTNDLTGGETTYYSYFFYGSNDSLVFDSTYYFYFDLNTSYSGTGYNIYDYDSLNRIVQQKSYGYAANSYDSLVKNYFYGLQLDSILYTFDDDGFSSEKIEYSNTFDFTIVATQPSLKQDIKIYPNPVNDVLHFEHNDQIKSLVINNLQGKRMNDINMLITNGSIDVSSFKNGIYLLSIQLEDGSLLNKKVIVQH